MVALLLCACISTSSFIKSIFNLASSLLIMSLVPICTMILSYPAMFNLDLSNLDVSLFVVQPL